MNSEDDRGGRGRSSEGRLSAGELEGFGAEGEAFEGNPRRRNLFTIEGVRGAQRCKRRWDAETPRDEV